MRILTLTLLALACVGVAYAGFASSPIGCVTNGELSGVPYVDGIDDGVCRWNIDAAAVLGDYDGFPIYGIDDYCEGYGEGSGWSAGWTGGSQQDQLAYESYVSLCGEP